MRKIYLGSVPTESKYFKTKGGNSALMQSLIRLSWTGSQSTDTHSLSKAKIISLRVLSKMGAVLQGGNDLDILDLGLHDTAEDVRIEAVISMPVILMWSGFGLLSHMFKRLE